MRLSTGSRLGLMLLAVWALPQMAVAAAPQFTFTDIVDSFRPEPGGGGTMFNIPGGTAGAPGNSGKRISFVVNPSETGILQLWTSDTAGRALRKLVDTETPLPNGNGNFVGGYDHRISGPDIVLLGSDSATGEQGFYAVPAAGGAITELVNQDTQKPDGTGAFGPTAFFQEPFNVSHRNLVFSVHGATFAVPVSGAPLTEPLDPTQFFICESGYGLGGLGGYGSADVSGGTIAMIPFNVFGEEAVYAAPLGGFAGAPDPCAGSLQMVTNATLVASINTPVPADPNGRNFDARGFASPIISGNTVVFNGAATPLQPNAPYDLAGLYAFNLKSGTTAKLVDSNTPVPRGSGNFQQFGGGVISGGWTVSAGNIVFLGIDATGREGLYLVAARGGRISQIVAVGDTLPDGRVVTGNNGSFFQTPIQPDSLSGKSLAVRLDFSDPALGGGNGIYLVRW